MNNKKYLTAGIFVIIVVIGGGMAYYFDPVAINTIIGIDTAATDVAPNTDLLAIDDASSSIPTTTSDMDVNPAPTAAVKTKKSAQKKDSATGTTAAAQPLDGFGGNAVAPSTFSNMSSSQNDGGDNATTSAPIVSCSFPATAPTVTTKQIILNEVAWMGSPTSSTAEWMEIKNISTSSVNLFGWQLVNTSGKIKIVFSGSDALAAGGLRLLSRGTVTAAASTTQLYSGDLVNTGDTLAIMDPQCDTSDYLDASHGWPGGNNTTKQTLERNLDGIGWHTSALPGGTPGVENSMGPAATSTPIVQVQTQTQIPITPDAPIVSDTDETSSTNTTTSTEASSIALTSTSTPSSSPETDAENTDSGNNTSSGASTSAIHILIAVVQIAGASSSNDLIKLYNPTASAVDMSGWKLHKKSQTGTDYSLKVFPTGSTIAAGQSFMWANSTNGFSETVGANVSSTETLAADNSVALMDAAGNIIDAVAWGTGTDQYGEGPPYPTSPGANQLLSRRSSGGAMVDTDNNTNDFTLQ